MEIPDTTTRSIYRPGVVVEESGRIWWRASKTSAEYNGMTCFLQALYEYDQILQKPLMQKITIDMAGRFTLLHLVLLDHFLLLHTRSSCSFHGAPTNPVRGDERYLSAILTCEGE